MRFMIDEHVEWLDIAMHDALPMQIIESLTNHRLTSSNFFMYVLISFSPKLG